MEYLVILLLFYLAFGNFFSTKNIEKKDRMRAELYCKYRIWEAQKNNKSTAFFKSELFFIMEGVRKDVEERRFEYVKFWLDLPDEEKEAFTKSLQSKK